MSTTLTNGIIIPDNGSRNWGGDLANNWNIIDLNVGYMTDVKNRVTTLENSVAENTANIQINTSNISALQTSKQDVIEDLETIRAGASSGATAVQPSDLSAVATSGSYNDLTNKPTIPTVNNATLTIQKNGTTVKTFTANSSTNVTCNIEVPTKVSDLTNDSGFITDVSGKANDSEVVHKSGDETIGGIKTFSNDVYSKNDAADLSVTPNFYHSNHNYIFTDKNNVSMGHIEFCQRPGGVNDIGLFARDKTGVTHGIHINTNNELIPLMDSSESYSLGSATHPWNDIYATNATINTSDRNAKTSIKNIDDNILQAWDNVSLVSFKFKYAVEKKGDNARLHVGYIAQDIKEELAKYNIDACKYGLFCYNSWDAQEEKSHEEERICKNGTIETVKVIDTPAIKAGETYGLRYIECLVVECAYLRKKNKELENRISKLEKNLNA